MGGEVGGEVGGGVGGKVGRRAARSALTTNIESSPSTQAQWPERAGGVGPSATTCLRHARLPRSNQCRSLKHTPGAEPPKSNTLEPKATAEWAHRGEGRGGVW